MWVCAHTKGQRDKTIQDGEQQIIQFEENWGKSSKTVWCVSHLFCITISKSMAQSNLTYKMPQRCCSPHHDYNNHNKHKQNPRNKQGVRRPRAKRLIRLNTFKSLQVFPKDLSYLVSIYSKTFSNWAVIKSEVVLSATKLQLSVSCLMARFLSKLSTAVLVRTVITSHID